LLLFTAFLILLNICACSDPIFYTISREVPIELPIISGSPVNFAKIGSKLYTASGKGLWEYNHGNGKWTWEKTNSPGGWIRSIAASGDYLYVVSENNGNVSLKRNYMAASVWESLIGSGDIQSVFSADDNIFYSVRNGDTYSIYHFNTPSTPIAGLSAVSELRGVVSDGTTPGSHYFICTRNGIYHALISAPNAATLVDGSNDKNFVGIISLDNKIAAVTRDFNLHNVSVSGIGVAVANIDGTRYKATGALAEWSNTDGVKLLLVGREDTETSTNTGHTFGYVEIQFDTGQANHPFEGFSYKNPGSGDADKTTVDSAETFASTIGVNSVNHIFQFDQNVLFASTQTNGVWECYRRNNGQREWNTAQNRRE